MNRIRRLVLAGLVAGSFCLASPALADDDFTKPGLYVGVNGAYGLDLLSTEIAGALGLTLPPITYDNSWGLNARVGYRALSFLAMEVQYEWMQGIGIRLGGVPIGTYKPNTLTGNVKLILPTWRIQPYLLAGGGVAFWAVDAAGGGNVASGSGFGFRGGAGLDLYMTESLSLNAEGAAVLNTSKFNLGGTETTLYYFSIGAGLTYHF